jgi:hypothetical protein
VLLTAPAPLSVEEIAPVVLFHEPAVAPFALSVIVHEPLAATVPAVKLTLPDPATADAVPPHVLLSPFGVATISPVGNVSVNATPLSANALPPGFVIVNVSDVFVPSGILAAPNALLIVGGIATLTFAVLLVVPVPPWVEEIVPVVLGRLMPVDPPLTSTVSVQDEFTPSVAAARLIVVVPAGAVGVPLQVPPIFGIAAIVRPPVRVSEKPMPVCATVFAAGFVIVNVTVVLAF